MSNAIVPFSYGPFPDRGATQYYSVKHLESSDIAHASQVCKQWTVVFSDQNLWKALFEKEGIPLVSSAKERDYQKDFKVLYPITLSGKIISQYIGKVVEKIPPISEEYFNKLSEADPYEKPDAYEERKPRRKTFVFIVDPSFVLRMVDQDTPLALDDAGNLVEQTGVTQKKELKIPFSLKNLKILCSYPLNGKKNMPVFDLNSVSAVFDQCGLSPNKISVYFMRRHIVEESRGKPYTEQERFLKDGDKVIPLKPRALFDVISILRKGNCPDGRVPSWTYARHPDTLRYGNIAYHVVIGGFAPLAGVCVSCNFVYDDIGVAPGSLAEVLALAIDKGH